MLLNLTDYIHDVAKDGASKHTIHAYEMALERVGTHEVDTNDLPSVYKMLIKKLHDGTSYVYVKHFLAILFAWYAKNFDEPPFRGVSYHELYREIKHKTQKREHYSDEEIRKLFHASWQVDDGKNTWRAVALCFYAGLRITGCQNIAWSSITPVEGTECVTFRVKSKGKEYNGIISKALLNYLKSWTDLGDKNNQSGYIVDYDSERKTVFDKLYRARLMRSVSTLCPEIIKTVEERDGRQIIHKKNPFHSLRKSYAHKLNAGGVLAEDLRYLMNHTPVGVTFSHYIYTEEGKQPIDLVKRMALAYQKVEEFMHPTLIEGANPRSIYEKTFNEPIEAPHGVKYDNIPKGGASV